MKSKFLTLLCASAFLLTATSVMAATYDLDKAHTQVGFSVKHLMVSTAKGEFRDFTGSFDFDESKSAIKDIDVTIQVASVDTREPKRDEHLKSPDFFDAAKFPTMTFKSEGTTVKEGKASKIKGTLTIKGVSKPVTLDLTYNGRQTDPWGVTHSGFNLTGKINRKDFGVAWNAPLAKTGLDKGGVVVGEEVTIDIAGEIVPHTEKK